MVSLDLLSKFLSFSSTVTGFSIFHLRGTGQAELYLSTVKDVVGEQTVQDLIAAYCRLVAEVGQDTAAVERAMRRDILSDIKLGPVARNVIRLWYVGIWYELQADWRQTFTSGSEDRTFVVSPGSYTEGLLWPTIGANPSGAKPFGYGTWATAPRIDEKGQIPVDASQPPEQKIQIPEKALPTK